MKKILSVIVVFEAVLLLMAANMGVIIKSKIDMEIDKQVYEVNDDLIMGTNHVIELYTIQRTYEMPDQNIAATIYDNFSEEELNLLFHVVQAEVGNGYSFEQKVNVACVIFNRLRHDRFPDTLTEILTPSQFSPLRYDSCMQAEISDITVAACEYAFQNEDTTGGALFFNNGTLSYKFLFNDGAHNFFTYTND